MLEDLDDVDESERAGEGWRNVQFLVSFGLMVAGSDPGLRMISSSKSSSIAILPSNIGGESKGAGEYGRGDIGGRSSEGSGGLFRSVPGNNKSARPGEPEEKVEPVL